MSLLRRLEMADVPPQTVAPKADDVAPPSAAPPAESRMFRSPAQSQASEAQRNLKERVKRKLLRVLKNLVKCWCAHWFNSLPAV